MLLATLTLAALAELFLLIPGVNSALVDAASGWIQTIWACQERPASAARAAMLGVVYI